MLLACAPEESVDTEPIPASPSTSPTGTLLPHEAGTSHAQKLEIDGETRFYLLHVPASYDGRPTPVLVDFHGTASPPKPEEAYGLEAAIATAEAEGFILIRPRSRSSSYGGTTVYRWDQNPGDLERNMDFVHTLLDALSSELNLDEDRLYALGFSSGTNQVAMFAEPADARFDGFAHVGGGAWSPEAQRAPGRVYLATPYRDYMRVYHRDLIALLDDAGHPEAERLHRPSMSGHELYDDMVPAAWAWLDRGELPEEGPGMSAGWSEEPSVPTGTLAAHREGELLWLAGDDVMGTWSNGDYVDASVSGAPFIAGSELTSICLTGDLGAAVGNGSVVVTTDGGASWLHVDPLPEPGPAMFGYAHWAGVGCADGAITGVGYWSAGRTTDGLSWEDVALDAGGYRAQALTAFGDPEGRWLTTGYYRWLGVDGWGEPMGTLGQASWLLDVTSAGGETRVAVGDHGTILRSADAGETWSTVGDAEGELAAVAFRDDGVGLAVGREGRAWASTDRGLSWSDVSLGLNRMLADVVWMADGSAMVVGPEGSFRYEPVR